MKINKILKNEKCLRLHHNLRFSSYSLNNANCNRVSFNYYNEYCNLCYFINMMKISNCGEDVIILVWKFY